MSIPRTAPLVALSLLLAGCGEDATPRDADGVPLLLAVAERGDLPALDALLARSPTPDVRDLSGRTAADWAREQRQAEVLALLSARAKS